MILKAIRAGVGFGSGTETRYEANGMGRTIGPDSLVASTSLKGGHHSLVSCPDYFSPSGKIVW